MNTSNIVVGNRHFIPVAVLKNIGVIDDASAFFKKLPDSMKVKLIPETAMSFFQHAAELEDAQVNDWLVSFDSPEVQNLPKDDRPQYLDLVDKSFVAKRMVRTLH